MAVFECLEGDEALVFGEFDEGVEFVELLADSGESLFLLHGVFCGGYYLGICKGKII